MRKITPLIVCAELLFRPVGAALCQELGPAPVDSRADKVAHSTAARPPIAALTVNTQDRAAVVQLFYSSYLPDETTAAGWTGSIASCTAGATSSAYKAATLRRINYYRAMVGLSQDLTLNETYNANCQEAALMMSANNSLSHSPPSTWKCYTAAGATAAGQSNLALGAAGPGAIDLYIDDPGSNNTAAGHRRWILYPPQAVLGSGSVSGAGASASNALKVIGGWGTRPAVPEYVAWPPEGYAPMVVMPCSSRRWSFSYPSANFSNATVTMTEDGRSLSLTKETVSNGYGDNTLVWIPQWNCNFSQTADITYSITISNAVINSVARNFSYQVIAIDPSQNPPVPGAPSNLRVTQ